MPVHLATGRYFVLVVGGAILMLVGLVAVNWFLVHPSAVYSYSTGSIDEFTIGMSKQDAFARLVQGFNGRVHVKTREPYGDQAPWNPAGLVFTDQLKQSNYWVVFAKEHEWYVLLFRDGRLWRALVHVCNGGFGELEPMLPMFNAQSPFERGASPEDRDLFSGVTDAQADQIIKQHSHNYRVYFR